MSYIKEISNYNIKFKDEKSYLEARLENLELYPDISFIDFLQNEIYNNNECEIESIELVNSGNSANYITSIDFGSGSSISSTIYQYNSDGDLVSNGDLVSSGPCHNFDGDLVFNNSNSNSNSNFNWDGWTVTEEIGIDATSDETKDKLKSKDLEEPDDPIESRFDILDIRD